MRKLPDLFLKKDPAAQPRRSDLILELDVSVMTTIFGGGAEAGRNDSFDPFRIPSIRGQLRFWWRATRGGDCLNSEELFKKESAIWGNTDRASPVKLRILSYRNPTEQPAASRDVDGRWVDEKPRYVLFPAQENRQKIGKVYKGGAFRLEVRAPKGLMDDVHGALWAWFAFGGIGARTRRGCGALYSNNYANTWMGECMMGDGTARDWPVLRGGVAVIGTRNSDWNTCWQTCIDVLRRFRQDRTHERGRSKWPEPDEIRRLRKTHAPQHAPANPGTGFPRAALGLPIIFHFKTPGDPEPNTLNVVDSNAADEKHRELRMASPVILKPWPVSATEAVPLLVVLNTRNMAEQLASQGLDLVLKQKKDDPASVHPPGDEAIRKLVRFAVGEWKGQEYRL